MNIKARFAVVLLAFFGLNACIPEPEYSFTPAIDFKSIEQFQAEGFPGQADSLQITLFFTDGDGDLGLVTSDSTAPFNLRNEDGTLNPFYYNYFVEIEKQNASTGNYEVLDLNGLSLNGRFPRLNTLDRSTALEGDLRFSFLFFYGGFSPVAAGDSVRFKVQIADRALNLSNEVYTDPVRIGLGQ